MATYTIRKANISDVKAIHALLYDASLKGELLPRSISQLYTHLRDFYVAESPDGDVAGCCALSISWEDLGEIRSLAVAEEARKQGLGARLVHQCLDEACTLGLARIFTLTYVDTFFARLQFSTVSRETLPHKIWADCLNCPKFPKCDEIAMELYLSDYEGGS